MNNLFFRVRMGELRKVEAIFLSLTLVVSLFSFSALMSSSVRAAQIAFFSESFGMGSDLNNIPGWDERGDDDNSSTLAKNSTVSGEDTISPEGGRFGKIGKDEWICREINAVDHISLQLSYYWRGDSDAESSDDHGIVEYKAGSGSCSSGSGSGSGTWVELQDHDLSVDSSWITQSTFSLPATLNNTTFRLRFRNVASYGDEYFRVDGIVLTSEVVSPPDITPPVVTINPDSQTVEATSPSGATASFSVTAIDNVDGDISGSATCIPPSGSTFPLGPTIVACSATDAALNVGSDTATVTVVDTTLPVITLNGSATMELNVGDTYSEPGATASDLVDSSVSVVIGGASVNTAIPGIYVITYNATDASGNKAIQVTRTVTVSDVTAPVIQTRPNITIEATDASGSVVTYGDIVSPVSVTAGGCFQGCVPERQWLGRVKIAGVNYDSTDVWTEDAVGYTWSIPIPSGVFILDKIAYDIGLGGEAYLQAGYTEPFAIDDIDGNMSAVCTPASGSVFSIGTTAVACTATDTAGNIGTGVSFSVIVRDTTPPVITLNGSSTIALAVGDAYTEEGASSTDAVDTGVPVVIGGDAVNTAVPGTYIVTYNAVDDSGNNATQVTRTITVSFAPLVIGGEGATETTQTSAVIMWTTDRPATSRVVYGISSQQELGYAPNYGYENSTATFDIEPKVTSHSVTLTGLTAGTPYFYRVISSASPEMVGNEQTFNTPAVVTPVTGGGGGSGGGGGGYFPPPENVFLPSAAVNNLLETFNNPVILLEEEAPASQVALASPEAPEGQVLGVSTEPDVEKIEEPPVVESAALEESAPQTASLFDKVKDNWWWLLILLLIIIAIWWFSSRKEKDKLK